MFFYNIADPIALTEGAADAFLESVGVELFEDSIAIDGTLYEGAYGESILEAYGIFLFVDGIVLEGEIRDAVKAGKKLRRTTKEYSRELAKDPDYRQGLKDYKKPAIGNAKQYLKDRHTVGKDAAKENWVKNSSRDHERMYSNPGVERVGKKYHDRIMADTGEAIDAGIRATEKIQKFGQKVKDSAKAAGRKLSYGKKSTNESTIFSDIEII